MEKDIKTFIATDEEGNDIECEVLFSFNSEETEKHYLVYTDNTTDEEGNTKVYASTFDPEKDEQVLETVESDEEWKLIEEVMENFQKQQETKDEQ